MQKSKKILCNQGYHFIISGRYAASRIIIHINIPDQQERGWHYIRYYYYYYFYYRYYGVTRAL
ncbi:hypothetical protein WBG78_25870 [Chryseolinea sp. T2]|uniref:hypothetical protein n=1 Tax=Chryseolinea sp. T2 TaxID=3129255 RepID=UPI0030784F94